MWHSFFKKKLLSKNCFLFFLLVYIRSLTSCDTIFQIISKTPKNTKFSKYQISTFLNKQDFLKNYVTLISHQEVHGITFITQGTTMRSHQEIHGITSNPYHSHASPTNHRFIMHTNLMPIFNQPTNHDPYIFSYQAHKFQSIQSDITCIFTYFIL